MISDEILYIDNRFVTVMDQLVEEYHSSKIIRAKYTAYDKAKDKTLPGEGHPNKEMQKLAGLELAEIIKKTFIK